MAPKGLIAALAATTILTAGVALAADQPQATSKTPQTAVEKDFSKLSADGSKAYQDLTLTRLAIYDGDTTKAKSYVDDADQAFAKAKSDDTVYMKAESDLLTPQEMNAKQASKAKAAMPSDAKTAGAATTDSAKATAPASTPSADQAKAVAWLPVDGAISLDEDYTLNATKAKAVADANKSLAKGDSKGALDRLKLADVNMSVALEVVPLNQTIADVHQAASLIDSGKFYEGSQALRKVQMSARYDVSDYVAQPNGAVSSSRATDVGQPKDAPAPATH